MNKHSRVFKILEKIAAARVGEVRYPFAAAIVHRGDIVSIGLNKEKTDPIQSRFGGHYLHAELSAIKNALRCLSLDELKRSDLYVCRVDKDSKRRISKPCNMCAAALRWYDLRSVYYCDDKENVKCVNY
jgi:tRNA(Arg) A34 adenosine deaminase TadA